MDKAEELWKKGNKDESIKIYEDLITKDKNIVLFFRLGEKL